MNFFAGSPHFSWHALPATCLRKPINEICETNFAWISLGISHHFVLQFFLLIGKGLFCFQKPVLLSGEHLYTRELLWYRIPCTVWNFERRKPLKYKGFRQLNIGKNSRVLPMFSPHFPQKNQRQKTHFCRLKHISRLSGITYGAIRKFIKGGFVMRTKPKNGLNKQRENAR